MDKTFLHELNNSRSRLKLIWEEVGYDEVEQDHKLAAIAEGIKFMLKQTEDKELENKNRLLRSIDEAGLHLHNLTNDLKVENIAEPKIALTLVQLEKYLKEQVTIYQNEADRRKSELKTLLRQERDLCKVLGENVAPIPHDRIPTEETLEYLHKVIKSMEVERDQRQQNFRYLRVSILSHMEEMELEPSSPQERNLLLDVEELCILSQENIKRMKTIKSNLHEKVQIMKQLEADLKNKVIVLWDRLSIEEEKRHFFLSNLPEKTSEKISKLQDELKDLEEVKQQNIGRFINQLRRELEELWTKCYVSEDEKENFTAYFSEDYSEGILTEHENEVQKLQELYLQNEEIFLKIVKWQMLWRKVTELDTKANDPARLFGNRGCALLQEEKERKRVNIEMPRVEADLERRMGEWEKEHGRPFLVCGQTLVNFIQSQWNEYNEKKNREREIRQSVRTRTLEHESRHGVSRTTQPQPPPKKRHLVLAEFPRSKFQRTNHNERTPSCSSSSSSTSTSVHYPGSTLSRCSSRNLPSASRPSLRTRKGSSRPQNCSTLNSTDLSSYNKFIEGIQHLSERENIRSSVVPASACYNSPRNVKWRGSKPNLTRTPLNLSKASRCTPPSAARRRPPLTPTSVNVVQTRSRPPKAPCTLPRRRSARLDASKACFSASRNFASPGSRSQRSVLGSSKLTTPIRTKLNFLI